MGTINLRFIKHRRQELKISQEQMSEALGFGGRSSYGPYELGNASFKAEHLPKLCEVLDCSITDLYKEGVALNSRTLDETLEMVRKINELTQDIVKGDGA